VAENTEQLVDLSVEKGDLGAVKGDLGDEKDFIAEENVVDGCALRDDNIIVVKNKKGEERVYNIDRVEDGNEYEDPYSEFDEDDVNYEEEVENDVRVDEEVVEHCEPENDIRVDEVEQGVADESNKTGMQQDVDITNIGDVITPEWYRNFLNDTARIEEDVQSVDDGKVLQLWVGQRWEDIKSCRDHLREYAIERKFAIILPKNNSDKIVAVCKNLKCKFRVYVRRMNDGHTMRLRNIEKGHSCVGRTITRNPTANAPYIAKKIEAQMRMHHKSFTPADIIEHMWMYHNLELRDQ
ncbi:hypothetical protein FRX31_003463, partial [Thalictrum thalictroides]